MTNQNCSRRGLSVQRAAWGAWMLAAALLVGCGQGGPNNSGGPAAGDGPKVDRSLGPTVELTSADEVLEAMAQAYRKARSYRDNATVRVVIDRDQDREDHTEKFAVRFERPNKLHVEAYALTMAVDGRTYRAKRDDMPDQYVEKDAPPALTWPFVFADQFLAKVVREGFGGDPPQLTLLLEQDALKAVLGDSDKPKLEESGEIEGRPCYRVKVQRPEGTSVFWIDKQSFLLRRFEYPVDELYEMVRRQGPVKSVSMVADFAQAQFDAAIPAEQWAFRPPTGAQARRYLLPPDPAQLLNRPVPAFEFVDLQGNKVTPQTLAGKIVVLEFWGIRCGPCRQVLPLLEKIYQGYVGSNVVILAVNVDPPPSPEANPPGTTNEEVADFFRKLNLTMPIVRDPSQQMQQLFLTSGIPCKFLIDARGIVQDLEIGPNPDLATELPAKLEKLRAGEDIYAEHLQRYEKQLKQYERLIDLVAQGMPLQQAIDEVQETPRTTVAPRSEPRRLRLTSLWKNADVKDPGNIAALSGRGGAGGLAVIESAKGIAELSLDGRIVQRHRLLPDDSEEVITALRIIVDKNGGRWLAAFAPTHQRAHLVDDQWKLRWSFPADALENRHSGIADVQLADLDGDGVPEMYVGYFGVVGVHAVSLEGRRTAVQRQIANVTRMAVGGFDPQIGGVLYCTNSGGPLVVLDAKLERVGEVAVGDAGFAQLASAELTGNPQPQFCGLAVPQLGKTVAIGFDAAGQELWQYALPEGIHERPVEQIIVGRLAGNTGQWILPGCDGSIHVLSPQGELIERFNYGRQLTGLAVVEHQGRPTLIVATNEGIEAFAVE